MKQASSTHPVISLRDGALKVSIWENEGENGTYLSATFAKTYTKDGKPADGHIFGRHDLLPLSELARRAYTKIHQYRELKKETKTDLSHER